MKIEDLDAWRAISTETVPPPPDPACMLGLDATRYVAGWPASYVLRYAKEYADALVAAERERICRALPGGNTVDPQWVADMVRGDTQ